MPTADVYRIEGVVADGALETDNIRPGVERGYISVLFYDADPSAGSANVVTPTAGTITFEASETGDRYGTVSDGTIDASQASYPRPNFAGAVRKVRATCAGITGATHYRARIAMFANG